MRTAREISLKLSDNIVRNILIKKQFHEAILIRCSLSAANAKVVDFVRFEVGEGIQKKVDDFVSEVMAQARK